MGSSPRKPCLALAVLGLAPFAACHHDSTPPDAGPGDPAAPMLVGLSVTPSPVSLRHAADRIALTITGNYDNGIPQDLTSDPGLVFTFDTTGVAGVTDARAVAPLADGAATLTIAMDAVHTTVAIDSDICKPRSPILDASTVFAFQGKAHIAGQAPGADRVRLALPHSALEIAVTAGAFATDVAITTATDDRSETWSATAVRDACLEPSAAAFVHVHDDQRAPELHVATPLPHAEVAAPALDVFGTVHDVGSAADALSVKVNGTAAELRAGIGPETSFVARGVALVAGANDVVINATDAAGNTTVQTIQVFSVAPSGTHLELTSGSGQEAEVLQTLAAPLQARVVDAAGQPVAGKLVTFSITHSDGKLAAGAAAPDARIAQSRTGADGVAAVRWQLGSAAGLANNVIEARATGVAGVARFWASARPGAARQIGIVDTMPMYAEAGAVIQERPKIWVNDGCNGIAGASVTFSIAAGSGQLSVPQGTGGFHGQRQVTLLTDVAGYAEVDFALGADAGKQAITAALADHPEIAPAVIEAVAVTRRSDGATGYAGRVVSDSEEALGGATLTLAAGGQQATTTTAADGSFAFAGFPGAGVGILTIDGTTVTLDGGQPIARGSYPPLTYDVNVIAHADNLLGRPIFLPELRTGNSALYSTAQPTVLTMADMPGIRMTIAPGSMKLANGTVAPGGTRVSINPVDPERIPMPLPSGAGNPLAWTLQPSGARFDPPVQVELPNAGGLAPGTETSLFTFDHDLGRFELVARGSVSEDGSTVTSDPGTGITKAGWGSLCPPYSLLGNLGSCSGLGGREFWDRVIKLGLDIVGQVTELDDGLKCLSSMDKALLGFDAESTTCKKAVAAADGALGVAKDCFSLIPTPGKIAERISNIAGDIAGATEVIKSTMCLEEGSTLARANEALGMAASIVKTGTELVSNIKDGNRLFGAASLAVAAADKVVCPLVDGEGGAELAEVKRDVANARSYFDRYMTSFATYESSLRSYNDALAPLSADASEVLAALEHPELAGCEISAGGQTAIIDATGDFLLRNIVARDDFGSDGPGTPRDFLSDDLFRIIGTCGSGTSRTWIVSDYYRVAANRTVIVPTFTTSSTPPAEPDRLALALAIAPPAAAVPAAAPTIFTRAGQTGQLTTTAALTSGTTANVTAQAAGTTYRSSNLAIAHVDTAGVVTARATGTAYITASNGGVSAAFPVIVALGDPLTRVEGRVAGIDGSPVAGATVTTSTIVGTSASDGSFTLDGVPTLLGDIIVAGRLGALSGSALPAPPHPGLVTDVGDVVLGRRDSLGTDFLVLFERNLPNPVLTLFLSGPVATSGVAEIGSLNFSQGFSVVPGRVTTLTVPTAAANLPSDTIARLAIHVTSDQEISVYGLNGAAFSTDAFAATPTDALGMRYRVMAWPGSPNGPSQLAITATSDATSVTITPAATAGARTIGVPYTITLNALDSYSLEAAAGDLTGTLIEASAPVAVFSGHLCANIPQPGTGACDHLTEQMPPTTRWGSEVLSVPLATRRNGDQFRILADRDGTQVTIDGPQPQTATLAAGAFLSVNLTSASRISATAPILVMQYANGQGFDGVTGDPMMMTLLPASQFARGYTFATPSTIFTSINFANIVAPAGDLGTVLLDGKPVNPALFKPLPDSSFAAAQVALSVGAHVVSSPAPIGLYVYGFANFDAYGYVGGFSDGAP